MNNLKNFSNKNRRLVEKVYSVNLDLLNRIDIGLKNLEKIANSSRAWINSRKESDWDKLDKFLTRFEDGYVRIVMDVLDGYYDGNYNDLRNKIEVIEYNTGTEPMVILDIITSVTNFIESKGKHT